VTAFGKTYDRGPGQAIFISVNGNVFALQWDGTAFDNLFNTNFPLFGRNFDLDPRFTQSHDNPLDLNDQLDAIGLRSLTPPPLRALARHGEPGRLSSAAVVAEAADRNFCARDRDLQPATILPAPRRD
jgi:hypothetical protein